MESIYLPQLLKAPEATEVINFEENFDDLETLMPVKGWLKVVHQGTYLDISCEAHTIVTLVCDRCLQQYNHRLSLQTGEMMWLQAQSDEELYEPGLEIEVPLEELVETLRPDGHFDPKEWVYQHLCLELPQRKLCDQACEGIEIDLNEEQEPAPRTVDHRWAALESLKNQL